MRPAAAARLLLVGLASGGALLPSCGGSGSPPTMSTPTTTLAAAPAPTPPGTVAASCSLGKGDANADCTAASGTAQLQLYVETAIDMLEREQRQLVDPTREEWPNSGRYYVKDVEGYLDAVVNNVRRQGACAERDADSLQFRRVLVKDDNEYSEGFRLVSEKGYVQRGRDARDQYCEPASFPVDRSGDVPPAGSGCGKPYPPPIHHFNAKIHTPGIAYVTLDSTPVVGPDVVYCATIGYTDNRSYCPVRAGDGEERAACEAWRVGKAEDTGRYGPTWKFKGQYCTGPASGCQNHPDNQYGLFAYENGTYVMCGQNGACGEVEVAR